jgi:mRNA interferase HicA
MKKIDLVRRLESVGYRRVRNGDHHIYEKKGSRSVQVPFHREIDENTARAILKIAGVKKSNSRKLPKNNTGRKEHE